ncbi:hypothetical protein X798_02017 [Onchocerca flexuosa]|uniref:Uncharacterized protein n=1 Tax=Onchocerca flexuosa TaxID=387005 RepID=A0A238C050_9BILA|nr:hypothetical protein X798_02017 [Onchocerca flexuosa]
MNLFSSMGYMGTGHKVLFVWLLLLLALIFLVVYLDGGMDGEPSIFFMILGFFDIFFLSSTTIRVMRHYQICGVGRRQYDLDEPYPVTAYFYPLDKRTSAVAIEYSHKNVFSTAGIQSYFRNIALYSIEIRHDPDVLVDSAILVISIHLNN